MKTRVPDLLQAGERQHESASTPRMFGPQSDLVGMALNQPDVITPNEQRALVEHPTRLRS